MTSNAASTVLAPVFALRSELRAALIERGPEVDGLLLALLAEEHLLLLGPPGVAKSALTKAFTTALDGASGFERLFTAFTTPEEVFGPFDIGGLRAGKYERQVQGYLPTAHVGFLDEVFKANSAILNALLTILNERAFDNGTARLRCPLEVVVGASNELPAGPELDALWDRFLVRRWVNPIADRSNRKALLAMKGEPTVTTRLSREALADARAFVAAVSVPDEVVEALLDIRDRLETNLSLTISDRRLRKSMKLVRAAAALDGRDTATLEDLDVLADALWQKPEDRSAIVGQIAEVTSPGAADALRLVDAAAEVMATVDFKDVSAAAIGKLAEARKKLREIENTVRSLNAGRHGKRVIEEVAAMGKELATEISKRVG